MPKPSKPRPVQPCAGADSEGLLAEQGRRQLAKNVFQVHGVDAYSPRSSSNANSLWRHALAEPTQVVTESQIHGSHADFQVRVLRGQPTSPVSVGHVQRGEICAAPVSEGGFWCLVFDERACCYSLKALVRVGQLERPCRLFGHAECRDLFCLPGNLRRLWLSCLSSLSSQTATRPGRSWRIHRPARRWGGRLRKRRRDLLGGLPPLTEGKDYAAPGSADYSQELGG